MSSSSRAAMVRSAAALFGSRGLTATSFSDVLAVSGAPRGSIYHHFPGGKKQLAQDAIGWTSEQVLGHLRACPADTPASGPRCGISVSAPPSCSMWRANTRTSRSCWRRSASVCKTSTTFRRWPG